MNSQNITNKQEISQKNTLQAIINDQKIVGSRYRLIKEIGEGGMATVFLCRDLYDNRNVAIKVLKKNLVKDEKAVQRWEREIRNAVRLQHENIVQILNILRADSNHYIVMEYVDGETLKRQIQKRGTLLVEEAVHYMTQIIKAVHACHEFGILHRDIKPQNIIITANGICKVTDFGISITKNDVKVTDTQSVVGSVQYMAPECSLKKETNEKADVYALGIIFYEMLTGKLPFDGETPTSVALAHIKEPIPSVKSENPLVPQSIENFIIRATAKHCDLRFNSAAEMLENLYAAVKDSGNKVPRLQIEKSYVTEINGSKKEFIYTDLNESNAKQPFYRQNWFWISTFAALISISITVVVFFAIWNQI